MSKELTLAEAKALRLGDTVYSLQSANGKGEPHKARITGAVKTWKRDASRVQVPWKHGLYVHGYITERNMHAWTLDEGYAREHARK
jgi:hypothetical protein